MSAGAVFVASIVLDALTALPTTVVVDVPTSLRTTALVLATSVAAPPVAVGYIFRQRGFAAMLLLVVAFVGLHNGGVNARVADAVYSLLGGWVVLLIFGFSGPKETDSGYNFNGKRENVAVLAASFLGYSGARIVRSALYHPGEVMSFSASHDDIETRGYALADDLVSTTLVFGGTLCICTAAIVLINHDVIYQQGCTPVAFPISQISPLIFLAAFVVQVACYARLDEMGALFGDSACLGDFEVCENSFRARRLYTANSSPASLWACAVGVAVFAFPHDRRCRTRRDYYTNIEELKEERHRVERSGSVPFVVSTIATLVVYTYADSVWPALELLLLLFSIPVAWYWETWKACVLHAAGLLFYITRRLGSPLGFDLTFLTHWYVAVTLIITTGLAVTSFVSLLLYRSKGRYHVEWIEIATAVFIVALVSIQLFLIIASLAIISGYDGSMTSSLNTASTFSWRSASLQWVTQHSLSFFFAAALVGGRFECHNECISQRIVRIVWFSAPMAIALLWIFTVYAMDNVVPYGTTGDGSSIAIAILAALLPWTLTGVVMC